jgi:hypothetical protein
MQNIAYTETLNEIKNLIFSAMLKSLYETINFSESKKDFDKIIKDALELELRKMKNRNPERADIKFRVLQQFVSKLENQPFEVVFDKLSDPHKHAIITRLENQAEHMDGNVPYDFIKTLEQKLYGVVKDEDEEYINFERKAELEKQLQPEN